MKDDYLWDRSGEPDPDVARLERLLEPLRHRSRSLDDSTLTARPPARVVTWTRDIGAIGIAAGLILVAAAGVWVGWSGRVPDGADARWVASPVHGAPALDAGRLRADAPVTAGEWIETDSVSSLRLSAGDVGEIEIGPGTRLRVVRSRQGEHRLALSRGSLHARIWAPPGHFAVETPSATAHDLGCSYAIEVDGTGAGRLHVVSGWVGLDSHGGEAFVPEGASCRLRAGAGPGTPYFDDAPRALVEALERIDADAPAAPREAVNAALAAARPRDALTLWHLLSRLDGAGAALAYDRLAAIAPPPRSIGRDQVLSRDRKTLEAWWDSLGLGSSSLFRTWRARPPL